MTWLIRCWKNKRIQNDWFQIVASNISAIPALTTGMLFAWASPSIPILISEHGGYNFTLEQCSYFPVISAISGVIYCVIPGLIMDKIGRKLSLLLLAVWHISVCLLYTFSKDIKLFYFARILSGIGDASLYATVPVYLGEILTPKVRGTWGNVLSVQIYVGQFLANLIGGYLNIQTTALIILAVPLLFLPLLPILPESPYYLTMKNKPEEAKRILRKLRRVEDVNEEFEEMKAAINRQLSEPGAWKDLFTIASNRRGVMAAAFMRIAQPFSGYAALTVYTKYIFQQTAGSFTPTESAVIFSGTLMIMCLLGSIFVDKLGRRASLILSITGITLTLAGEAVYFFLEKYYTDVNLDGVRFLPLIFLIGFVFFWSTGLGIVPNLMLGELFSANIKGKALTIANVAQGSSVSASTKIFQVLEVNYGMWSPFAFFAGCSFVFAIVANFIIPETRLKTLEQIQISLKGGEVKNYSSTNK